MVLAVKLGGSLRILNNDKIHNITRGSVKMSQKTKRNYCAGCKKETIWDYYEARGGFSHWKCRDCGEKETF